MKLAFITATPQNVRLGSGTFVGTAYLMDHLRYLGHRVDIHAPSRSSGMMGYTARRFAWNLSLNPRDFNSYDVVVGLDMDGYTIADRLQNPFVAYIHGIIADEAQFERGWVRLSLELMAKAERLSVHRANQVITVSTYSCKRLGQLYQYSQPIARVPPPFDLQGWDRALTAAAAELPDQRPTVLCVGVQYPRKNVLTLIRAAAILRNHVPTVEVRIASQGPEWPHLCRLAKQLQLQQTVTFLGYLAYPDLVREYINCQVFCLPSLQEGFGLVFAEAMATAKPIVASRSSSTPELIEDGIQGLLATPLDAEDLAEKLATILLSPDRGTAMGKAGRSRVGEFEVSAIANQFIQVLESL